MVKRRLQQYLECAYDIFNETGCDIAAIAYEKSLLKNLPAETENGRNGRQ
jgi:hypothetical protein